MVTSEYSDRMLLTSLMGTSNYMGSPTYDSAGRVTAWTLGNGLTTTFGYNAWSTQGGRLASIVTGSLQNLGYTYDAGGNITQIVDGLETSTYAYDGLGRLADWTLNNTSESYIYDATTGNLASKAGVSYEYGDSAHEHAVTAAGTNTYSYDGNGNMTCRKVDGRFFNVIYDAENRLTKVQKLTQGVEACPAANTEATQNVETTFSFAYDGDGHRVKSTAGASATYFVGNIYELTGETATKYYYAGGTRVAMRVGDTLSYLLSDHLGSTTVTTDVNGYAMDELKYKPWGEVRSGSAPTNYTYTGQYSNVDDFGLMFYNARWMDPALGRFASADSVVSGGVQGLDRYAYASNNPLRYNDPSGHWFETVLDFAFMAYDMYDISTNGLNWENGLSLTADVACAVIPIATGGGLAVRAIAHADDVADVARVADKAKDAANAADTITDAVRGIDDVGDGLVRVVPVDQVGTSQPFKILKGEDGLSVFEGISPGQVLSEFPGTRIPNTTVTIPKTRLPPGTRVVHTPADALSRLLSDAHRELIRPDGWSVNRFAKFLKELVGWK